MNTETTNPTTTPAAQAGGPVEIPAYRLAEMLAQVGAHTADPEWVPTEQLAGVHLDADGAALHLVASDRFTLAVARKALDGPREAWSGTLAARHVTALAALAKAAGHDRIELTVTDALDLTASSPASSITVPFLNPTKHPFPDWRQLITRYLAPVGAGRLAAADTERLARWAEGGRRVRIFQDGPTAPFVVTDFEAAGTFIGVQMPARLDDATTRDDVAAFWSHLLGEASEHLEDAGTAARPGELFADPSGQLDRFDEQLLRRVVVTSNELADLPTGEDPAARARFDATVHTLVSAWTAHRLLRVLTDSDPALAARTVAELEEELDGGEFGEIAYDLATKAGHDPNAWADEHQEAARARDAKWAAAAAEDAAAAAGASS